MTRTLFGAALLAALALGCTRRLPGSDIEDTPDTRAVLEVMEKYRAAVEAKDAQGVIALVSESFRDDFGTISTEDDLDYSGLREVLPQRLSRVDRGDLEINVKGLNVQGEQAVATYYYTYRYKLPSLTQKPQSDADLQQMWLKKVGGSWKIIKGI
jgi:hypothetical protein